LEALGIDVPVKPSPTVPNKMIPAVAKSDESLTALLSHPDEKVVKLVEGRLAAKSTIGESRAARMIAYGTDMLLPIYLSYCGAHTMRWTGGDKFNPQNFKQAQKTGGELRKCIIAPNGYQLVVVDASQIEARITAWFAGQEDLLEDFRLKRDPYCAFASKAYGRPITKEDKEERFVGKTCVLGLGYGMGGAKLQTTILSQSVSQGLQPIRLSLDVCYGLVSVYRRMNYYIPTTWAWLNDRAILSMLRGNNLEIKGVRFDENAVQMPNGLCLHYPGLSGTVTRGMGTGFFEGLGDHEGIADASYLTFKGRNKLYGGLLLENIVQCLARIFIAEVMKKVAQVYRVVMSTHDEIAALVPTAKAAEALEWIIGLMSTPPSWAPDLPCAAEGGYDRSYSK
jgi:DNA polymerase